ncbi:phosphotransferase family protein [Microlunatus elymi]|uniref:phosphotransferase family protein n=1 Tax=Microlunatus elymi TaxID=2596828 RepID=UPI00143D83EC|nr:aminoglycoside phosphotransferase family protein [Microlunatus elymi]
MHPAEVTALAGRLGISPTGVPTPVTPGLSGNELWRLSTADGDRVLRVFPPGTPIELADREVAAHRSAAEHGLRTPRVIGTAEVASRPALAMDWVEGVSVADALWSGEDSERLGARCGAELARLHQVVDVPPIIAGRDWIDWAGPHADELRPRLRLIGSDYRLLHLDFHPENLIIGADAPDQLWVFDWANVRVGPPVADLARTLSIMDLVAEAVPGLTDHQRRNANRFRGGLLSGYAAAGGDVDVPPLIMAWAYAVQLVDLAASWVPHWYFDRLRARYRGLVPSDGQPG